MTPLYEVWQSADPQGFGWGKVWQDFEPVRLPLPWAREYARELFELEGLPVEVRGTGPDNWRHARVQFGANHWNPVVLTNNRQSAIITT
jgi:hypothetical protein